MVAFDVHGLAPEIEEKEELIESSLKEMEEEIQKIKKKSAYDKALKMNPSHVGDRHFRLQFLRCESFKGKNAAKRLVFHFKKKEMLFGDGDVLGREVRLSDLSPLDLAMLQSGVMQVLPTRDVSGRSVFCWIPGNFQGKLKALQVQRTFYYIMATTSREEETQRKGFIFILYKVGRKGGDTITLSLVKKVHSMRLCIPHSMRGFHAAYDDKSMRPFVSGLRYFLDGHGRTRFRVHFGDQQKVIFQLQTFGIFIDENSPLRGNDGQLNLAWHQEWLQMRQAQEAAFQEGEDQHKIFFPHRFDVLFGRGKFTREHTGNLRAAHLVNMWTQKYDEAGKYGKTEIAERIVSIIHESDGRFLKWEKSGWVEVEDELARQKVSHWFRHQRTKVSGSEGDETGSSLKREPDRLQRATEAENSSKQIRCL